MPSLEPDPSRRDSSAQPAEKKRGALQPLVLGTTLLALVFLATSVATAVIALRQTEPLQETVRRANQIVEANVRVLAQMQREFLILHERLALPTTTPAELTNSLLRIHARIRETTLPYQESTYQSVALSQKAGNLRLRYETEVAPLVRTVRDQGPGTEDARLLALARITQLEGDYNDMLAEAERIRKDTAKQSADAAAVALANTKRQLTFTIIAFLGAIAVVLLGAYLVRQLLAERAQRTADLLGANSELLRYAHIVQATASEVLVTDAHGRVEWVNDSFIKHSGYDNDEMVGREPFELLISEHLEPGAVDEIYKSLMASGRWRGEIPIYSKTGTLSWHSIDIAPLVENGDVTGYVSVGSDVSEQHEATELLNRARRDAERSAAEKSAFLATMSHEIRTPLNSVLGLTDLLRLTELDDEQRRYVETAYRSGKHLLGLINDILEYSALDSGRFQSRMEIFDLRKVFNDVVEILRPQADAKGIELITEISDELPARLLGDDVHLRQIMLNLAGNAIKFTESGSVKMVVQPDPLPVPGLSPFPVAAPEHMADYLPLRLLVIDTGIGISEDRQASLFTPFVQGDLSTTRRYGGTGLGLAITKHLAEGLGGSISLDSIPHVGTRVEVLIPLRRDTRQGVVEVREDAAEHDWSNLRVLVAEDDLVNQTVITHMLRRLAIVPTVVSDGQQAVEATRQDTFDVILLDIQMPVLDGIGAMEQIRASLGEASPYLVAVTADALSGDRERFLKAGMDDYVAKPISLDAISAVLLRSLAQRAE